jgi:hypothetical protein
MPPRWLALGVFVLWIFMTGWLFVRDYWPQLQPGQPPPFRIDLADEAQNNIPVRWSIFKDGEGRGYARTWVNFRNRDDDPHQRVFKAGEWEFELGGEFKLWRTSNRYGQPDFLVKNKYRVTREGALREFQSTVSFNLKTKIPGVIGQDPDSPQEESENSQEIELVEIFGKVQNDVCYPRMIVSPEAKKWVSLAAFFEPLVAYLERPMEPIRMPTRAAMLNPLEPVNKLAKVSKGQRWRIPMVDPMSAWQKSSGVQYLNAEVLQDTEWIKWGGHKEPVPCLVIKYQGDDLTGYTWVQEEDGLVVGQEITQHGDNLRLMRD